MKNSIKIILFTLVLGFSSCSKDYLDVSKELKSGLTNVKEVFDNVLLTRGWYANVFTNIPDYSNMVSPAGGISGIKNPWTGMTDEINVGYGDNVNYMISFRNSSNMGFNRWNSLYTSIRQANIFLENVKIIPASGVNADKLEAAELDPMIANVKFMRAYYHYLLLEQYGPVPIMDRSYKPEEDYDVARSSVDEVVNFIDAELLKVIPLLPQTPITDESIRALPTKGVALAVRAKLWIHAASPLLNGGFTEALTVANKDGKKLFPAADATKWVKAKNALKDLIDYADAGNYQLYKNTGVFDPTKSVYELFQGYNNEIIWATSVTAWGGMDGDQIERRSTPRSERNGLGSTAVLQELVDDFYMKDGMPTTNTSFLTKSPLYSETGTGSYTEAVTVTAPGAPAPAATPVNNMYMNREPRFYNTVFFAGRRWHVTNNVIQFYSGSANDRNSGDFTPNGYLLYKRFNRQVNKTLPGLASKYRPSIIFRLAEFYLLYAEALNEADPGNSDVLRYVNLVRERAGLPKLEVLNPAIAGNKDLQREAIRRESRIELATEGQRYFDVRRWMIAETPQGRQAGDFFGMNMVGNATTFYQRTKFQTRVFERKQYLHPIPLGELQKSNTLVQNWGW